MTHRPGFHSFVSWQQVEVFSLRAEEEKQKQVSRRRCKQLRQENKPETETTLTEIQKYKNTNL